MTISGRGNIAVFVWSNNELRSRAAKMMQDNDQRLPERKPWDDMEKSVLFAIGTTLIMAALHVPFAVLAITNGLGRERHVFFVTYIVSIVLVFTGATLVGRAIWPPGKPK